MTECSCSFERRQGPGMVTFTTPEGLEVSLHLSCPVHHAIARRISMTQLEEFSFTRDEA